jgi:hypothetical protein
MISRGKSRRFPSAVPVPVLEAAVEATEVPGAGKTVTGLAKPGPNDARGPHG